MPLEKLKRGKWAWAYLMNQKIRPNYHTVVLISHASKIMLKILQASLQQYINQELPDVQAGFRKSRGTEIKLPTSVGSQKTQDDSRKAYISASLTMLKSLTVWITTNLGKIFFFKNFTLQYCISFAIHQQESSTGVPMFLILTLLPTFFPIPSLWVISVYQTQASCTLHRT